MNDQADRSANSGRTKDVIITAIASVLVAVIGAAGVYINSSHRDRDRAEAGFEHSTQELKILREDVSSLQLALKKANDALLRCGKAGEPIRSMAAAAREQSEQGFTVALQRCLRSGTAIDCDLTITNKTQQQYLTLAAEPGRSDNSRAIDDHGQQLEADGGTIAGVTGRMVRFDTPSNIELPAVVRFREVPTDVKRFSLIELSFFGHRDFKLKFVDVDLAR